MCNITEEEKIGIITGRLIRVCNRCGCEVVFDDWGDYVSPNYDCACLVCDEDLDFWETRIVPKKEVKLFITNNDKEHYKKHGHLPLERLEQLDDGGV